MYGPRQWAAPTAADSTAPTVIPSPTLVPHTAVAWVRRRGSVKSWARIARPQASTAAPPTPSSTRPATNPTASQATPHATAPIAIATSPAT